MKKITLILCYSLLAFALSCKEDDDTPLFELSFTVIGKGTVNTNPANGPYEAGSTVNLEAIPDTNWKFAGWKGDVTGTSDHLQVTMNKALTITAEFVQNDTYTLDINVTGEGTVTANPDLPSYPPGTTVTLTAEPKSGYELESWGPGITSGELELTIVMDENVVIAPKFVASTSAPLAYGYSIDPTNPLIFKTFTNEGDVYFYGTKFPDGTVSSINFVSVKTNAYEQPVIVSLDATGRPASILSPKGDALEFIWSSNSKARVRVLTSTGNQVNFPLDLNDTGGGRVAHTQFTRRAGSGTIAVTPIRDAIRQNRSSMGGRSYSSSSLTVAIEQCDGAFNEGTVMLLATGKGAGGYQAQYKAVSNGDGSYSFNILVPQTSQVNSAAVCSSVTSKLSFLCNYVDPLTGSDPTTICSKIAELFNKGNLPVYEGCEILLKSLKLYCSALGSSPAPGAPQLGTGLCTKPIANTVPTSFTFQPAVYVKGGDMFMANNISTTNVNGPFPDINLELPTTQTRIASFITEPFDPAPEEGYDATATIVCGVAGTKAKISIEGTDGYKDERTVTLPAGNSYVTLGVPGSWDGVQDNLAIEVDGVGVVYNVIVF